MTLAELIAEVYTLTGRPDRVAETASAIKSATLKAHQCDFFYKDIFESGVSFSSSEYVQNLDYRTLIPLWRAVKYLRKWDVNTGTAGKFITLITPAQLMDRYGVEKDDIYYAGGAELTIKCSSPQQYFLLGAYVNPDITTAGYNSWVALDHPFAIIYDAAATVFKAIGKDEEAAAMRGLVAEQIAMVRTSNILPEGY